MLSHVFIFAVGDKSPLNSLQHNHKHSAGLQADDTRRKATTRRIQPWLRPQVICLTQRLAAGRDLHGGPSFHFLFPLFGIWPAMKIGIWYTLFQEVRCGRAVGGLIG